jgi:threonylcarbamoyladenosine tRNA methylthiotransferase MtaB
MARQYTCREFLEKVELLKSELDRPAITTDIIVGFPGESERDFRASCDVAGKVGFSKIHIFPFSPRTGTAAAKMKNTVNNKTKKERAKRLKTLAQELAQNYRRQFTGETCNVLVEKTGQQPQGLSERYFPVTINNSNGEISENDIAEVKLTGCSVNGLIGEV